MNVVKNKEDSMIYGSKSNSYHDRCMNCAKFASCPYAERIKDPGQCLIYEPAKIAKDKEVAGEIVKMMFKSFENHR